MNKKQYSEMTLAEFADYARNSSPEIGALSGYLLNYETGQSAKIGDDDTHLFLASAREMVLELVRRLQVAESKPDKPKPTTSGLPSSQTHTAEQRHASKQRTHGSAFGNG